MKTLAKTPSQWPQFGNRFSRWFGCQCLRLMGWKFEGDFPDENKLIVAIAPHTSNWDFIVGMSGMIALGIKGNWLAKHSLFVGPFRRFFLFLGGIPVNRSATEGFVENLKQTIDQREFVILGITPEGTRKHVGKFKTGFLRIAQAASIPVLFVALDYASKTIVVGDVFTPTGDLEADERYCYEYFKRARAKYPEQY